MKNIKVEKKFVDVICLNNEYGELKPLYLVWDEDNTIPILAIKEIKTNASIKIGDTGLRYTCVFSKNQEKHLYYDRGKWYVKLAQRMI